MPMTGNYFQEEISLYFHIPFCTKKCDYCHFYVLPDKVALHQLLIEGLELDLVRCAPLLAGKKLHSIYFGGGTPALLGAGPLAMLLDKVRTIIPFENQEVEITLEANPERISPSLMQAYSSAGVNRVSIGIQTLDDGLLGILGRTHRASAAIKAIEATASAGIPNISIDLMYDIPGQTLASWKHTLMQIANMPITHLSLYNLTIEPHTVFFKYRESLQKQLPDAECSAEMYQTARETFDSCGLKQYEISAFAKKDFYSRHNIGYWTGRPFLGFGPSAFSYWEGRRFRAVANLQRYVKALSNQLSPEDFSETLPPENRRRELLAIALRLLSGVDLVAFEAAHGSLNADTHLSIQKLQQQGLLVLNGNHLALTDRGLLFYDTVATEIV